MSPTNVRHAKDRKTWTVDPGGGPEHSQKPVRSLLFLGSHPILYPLPGQMAPGLPLHFLIAEGTGDHHVQLPSAEIVSIIRTQQIGNGRGPRNSPVQKILHLDRKAPSCNLFPQADRQKLGALESGIGILTGRVQEKGEVAIPFALFRQGKRIHGHQPKRGPIRIHLPPQGIALEVRIGIGQRVGRIPDTVEEAFRIDEVETEFLTVPVIDQRIAHDVVLLRDDELRPCIIVDRIGRLKDVVVF